MSPSEKFPRFPFKLPMLLDGSTGTSLMRAGMPAGSCTERWVLENPDKLIAIQDEYRKAGSDAVYSPTFGANRPTLERAFEDELPDIADFNSRLTALSVGRGSLVGGDLSPTGLFIEPYGDTPFDEVVEIYREQAEALEAAGVDFFVSETNISLAEARAAVIGIREVSEKPIFVTVTVDENGRTLSGDSLICCLLSLAELGIAAFGTNCSQGPERMLELLSELVPYSVALGIPLVAKPNAGLPHEDEDGSRHFDLCAEDFAAYASRLLEAGIPILGGCCGTDGEYIRLLRTELDSAAPDYLGLEPADLSRLVCTNRILAELDEAAETVIVDENFFDKACELESPFIALLSDASSADTFLEAIPILAVPCALRGDSDAILRVKRYFSGRMFVI